MYKYDNNTHAYTNLKGFLYLCSGNEGLLPRKKNFIKFNNLNFSLLFTQIFVKY